MTDHQDHDTEAAPTEQASPPTTELPPASHAAASPEAWSLDDTADLDAPTRHSRLVWSALVALVVAIAGALIFLATTLFGSGSPKPVEPKAQPTTTVPVQQPGDYTPDNPGDYTADDLQFLKMYHRLISGWKAQPPADEPASDPVAVSIAHDACRLIRQSDDPGLANQRVSIDNGWSIQYAYQFVSVAMTAYPDCVGPSAYRNH